ncbi:MAG: T9SS type A sorting domain-containing protein [Flavobacteriales bacterium]|nr:T9SS type A sorting domain-containing protein [Flavobacteriales bacterium]
MRHVLLVALLLPTFTHSQCWAPVGALWTYKQGSCCGPDTNLAVIRADGDTVINGRDCTKLIADQGWFGCYSFVRYFSETNDSLYFYDTHTDRFTLLFQWNAMPGDTWYTEVNDDFSTGDTLDWTVIDTGQVVIDGLVLRNWQVQVLPRHMMYNAPIGHVTERLGPFGSPFTWTFGACDGETFLQLRCYEDDGISWQNSAVPQCALSTHISGPAFTPPFKLRPNPVATGEPVLLDLHHPAATTDVVVHDALGREIARMDLKESRASITLPNSGVYVVTLQHAGHPIAQQRLIVH